MRNTGFWTLILAGALALGGCQFVESEPSTEPIGLEETGLSLTVDVSYGDVEAMRFNIDTCDGDNVVSEEVSIDDGDRFANYFATIDPGCYDVEIQPLDDAGDPSQRCEPATAEDVVVEDGETTDLILVSQCDLDQTGGLDVLGVLNFAPEISVVEVTPSTDVACEAVQVCATALDSDGDPIEFAWTQLDGPTPVSGPEVISSTGENGEATECIEMTPGTTGEFLFEVTAYDLIEDEDGDIVRIEEIGQRHDDTFTSHASANLPVNAVCEEDVLGEIEDDKPKKDKPYEEEEADEDVLGELEDIKDEHDDEEDVLGEVEDDKPKKDDDHVDDEEDVLGEVEDDKPKKDDDHVDDEEDVLGEVERTPETPRKYREEVLAEIERDAKSEEDVLGELEDNYSKEPGEDVLGELENCTRPIDYWAVTVPWPYESQDNILEGYLWSTVVFDEVDEKRLWVELAQNYVVARVNIKAGADAPKGVYIALAEAEELLNRDYLEGRTRLRAQNMKGILMAYNEGLIGPGWCDDV